MLTGSSGQNRNYTVFFLIIYYKPQRNEPLSISLRTCEILRLMATWAGNMNGIIHGLV